MPPGRRFFDQSESLVKVNQSKPVSQSEHRPPAVTTDRETWTDPPRESLDTRLKKMMSGELGQIPVFMAEMRQAWLDEDEDEELPRKRSRVYNYEDGPCGSERKSNIGSGEKSKSSSERQSSQKRSDKGSSVGSLSDLLRKQSATDEVRTKSRRINMWLREVKCSSAPSSPTDHYMRQQDNTDNMATVATVSPVTSTISSSSGIDFQASVGSTPSPSFPGCDDPGPGKETLLHGYPVTSTEDCDGQVDTIAEVPEGEANVNKIAVVVNFFSGTVGKDKENDQITILEQQATPSAEQVAEPVDSFTVGKPVPSSEEEEPVFVKQSSPHVGLFTFPPLTGDMTSDRPEKFPHPRVTEEMAAIQRGKLLSNLQERFKKEAESAVAQKIEEIAMAMLDKWWEEKERTDEAESVND